MDDPIKIALVSAYDYAFPGAVTDHVRNLASHLAAQGHTVRVIAPSSDPDRMAGSDFIPMGRPVPIPSGGSIARISLSVWLLPRIRALLRDESFDIVHLHEPFSGFLPVSALSVSDAVNIATFHTYRGTRLWRMGATRLARPYFRKLHGRIAVSEPAREFISGHFPGNYEIIPNGVRVAAYSNGAVPFPHLSDGMVNLLFVGRLEKRKGLKHLLGAFSKLKWSWPNLRLVVVGPGRPDEDSYRIMSERNLQDVIFVGIVSEEDKIRYYRTADIFCAPATGRESFGIVLLEAMAAGKPIVATAIEGYSSVVTDGKEGLLVPPKNEDALAGAIDSLLRDPELAGRLAASGRIRAQEFRWESVAQRVMSFYRSRLDSVASNAS